MTVQKYLADRLTPLIAATLIGLIGGPVQAQTPAGTGELETVIVTGSRIAQ